MLHMQRKYRWTLEYNITLITLGIYVFTKNTYFKKVMTNITLPPLASLLFLMPVVLSTIVSLTSVSLLEKEYFSITNPN